MTAKEYLEQVRHKQAEIGNLKRDKEAVKDMLYSLGGGGEGERVQNSRNNDKFGTLFGRIDEMEVVTATLKSYLGMLDHCDCKEFRKELIDSVVLDRNKVVGEIAYEVENYSEAMVCGL